MKTLKSYIKVLAFLLVLWCAAAAKSESASAAAYVSCDSNESTKRACSLFNTGYYNGVRWGDPGTSRGAMWLNTVAGNGEGAQTDTIVVDSENSSQQQTVNVYLHGAIRSGAGGANCIRLSSYDPGVIRCERGAPSNDPAVISISGDYLGRNNFPGLLSSSYLTVKLNLNEVRKWSNYRDGEYIVYYKTLYGYRCYAGSSDPMACYADPIEVKIRIKDEPVEIDLTPKASASGRDYIGEAKTSSFTFDTAIDKKTNNNATNEVANNLIRNKDVYFYVEKDRGLSENWDARSVTAADGSEDTASAAACNSFGAIVCQPSTTSIPNDESYVGRKLCGVRITNQGRYKYDSSGNKYVEWQSEWKVSAAACVPIAKKMNMGVAGANVYLANGAETIVERKSGGSTFGSWVEFMAITGSGGITGGGNKGLSSGAGLASGQSGSIGLGNTEKWSSLTTGNVEATDNGINGAGVSASSGFTEQLKNSVLGKGTKIGSYGGADIYEGDGVIIYKASGDITISDNITNTDASTQIIIYSESGNVLIGENVERIDAWIIALSSKSGKGVVNTCYNYDIESNGSESGKCGKKLTINGLVYAQSLKLNRTYGGAGADTAELINLTPASFVWAYNLSSSSLTSPTTVYTRELAPRM